MNYREIRKITPQLKMYDDVFVSYLISARVSPFFTSIFLRLKSTPNQITIYMILSGIIGATFFSLPFIWAKILGSVFIHLWFIFDCSDGEVARITQKFSKFGKEMDLIAHVINHPLFNISFFLSMVMLDRYDMFFLAILFLILISCEFGLRNLHTFSIIYDLKLNIKTECTSSKNNFKKLFLYSYTNMVLYPNFALFFPFTYFIDYYFQQNISLYYLVIVTSISLMSSIRGLSKMVIQFSKN